MDGLGRQPEVPDHGDTHGGELAYGIDELGGAALELEGITARLLHDTDSRAEGLLVGDLIAAEGHIYDDEGTSHPAHDGGAVVDHLVEGDG